MLAIVQFAAPALLSGVAAATLPFLIHFLLRPRPRRVQFPAVTFLRAALASGQRAQRLRNLWLLLVRALLLACIAVLLAGPTCAPSAVRPDLDGPVACVLVVDDSWSMHYRLDGETTLLDRARAEAREFTRAAADWPQPSALGLVWADPSRPVTELTSDHAVTRARLREADESAPQAAPLHHALREAARLLQAARQPLRRLVVFTDQALHAWRDVAPGLLTGIENLTVRVCSVAPGRRTNIAITTGTGPVGLHPENLPVPVAATLTAAGLDATCFLVVRDGSRVIERVGPWAISADSARDVSLVLRPRPQGVHALTLEVEPRDRLPFDQQRYVVFQTSERPVAWLVTPADAGPDVDLTALLLRNLLAPEGFEPQRQLVTFRHLLPVDLGETSAGAPDVGTPLPSGRDADLILITGGAELNEAARQKVRRAAERGAIVLLLPGSREQAAEWPGLRRLLARAVLRVETLGSVTSFSWDPDSPFAGLSAELDELTRTAVRRRVVLAGLEDGVAVEARYADGVPAIVSLRRGRGRLVLLTTSPDPSWSALGMRAAGLLTWLHELLGEALGSPDATATFTAGETTRHSFAALPSRGVARVLLRTGENGTPISVRLSNGEPTHGWPTQQPGVYAVRMSRKDAGETLYAVNWPAEESDLHTIAADRLKALLGVADVALEGGEAAGEAAASTLFSRLTGLRDAARLLPLLLLGLVLGELLLAGRMWRTQAQR
ncbi:MAG: BatA domain-containing protein [Phycisphaerae bacterium]